MKLMQVDASRFQQEFGCSPTEIDTLIQSKSITLSRVMSIAPSDIPGCSYFDSYSFTFSFHPFNYYLLVAVISFSLMISTTKATSRLYSTYRSAFLLLYMFLYVPLISQTILYLLFNFRSYNPTTNPFYIYSKIFSAACPRKNVKAHYLTIDFFVWITICIIFL